MKTKEEVNVSQTVDLSFASLLNKDFSTGTLKGFCPLFLKTCGSLTLFRNTDFKEQVSLAACDVNNHRES